MSLNTAHPDQHKEENGVRGEEDENRNLCSRKNDQSREKWRILMQSWDAPISIQGCFNVLQSAAIKEGQHWRTANHSYHVYRDMAEDDKGRVTLPNQMKFQKSSKRGGTFSTQIFILQNLGTLNRAFWAHYLWKSCARILYYMASYLLATISIIKISNIFFLKMRGGGRIRFGTDTLP